MAVLGLTIYSNTKPTIVKNIANDNAEFLDTLPEGTGRFLVRFIFASKSFSMIWLYTFDAPTIQYPPTASISNTLKLICCQSSTANKYPAKVENTTLKASPAFVRLLNSDKADTFIVEVVSKINWFGNEFGLQIYFKKIL